MQQIRNIATLAGFLSLVAVTAATGIVFEPGSWYAGLSKPPWTPPNWLFGPVWTALYIGIGVAGWQVWRRTRSWAAAPMLAWAAQLGFNALWSWLFFGLHWTGLAFVDLLAMLGSIVVFIAKAYPISRSAALLFVPYALWVAYAGSLNLAIWLLN
ncbi:MAG: TspO/MBR family protein [Xanthomonadales bacterium]|nr:TspO/MBR family protein [Xanthomonadales bacterium]